MESLSLPEMFTSMGPRLQMSMSNGGMPVLPYTTSEMSRFSQHNQEASSCTYIQPCASILHNTDCTTSQDSLDSQLLNTADDSLADLEPEASDEEENTERPQLTEEQHVRVYSCGFPSDSCCVSLQKVEYMASLGLVPPAVLEGKVKSDPLSARVHNRVFSCVFIQRSNVARSCVEWSMETGGTDSIPL